MSSNSYSKRVRAVSAVVAAVGITAVSPLAVGQGIGNPPVVTPSDLDDVVIGSTGLGGLFLFSPSRSCRQPL